MGEFVVSTLSEENSVNIVDVFVKEVLTQCFSV